MYGGVDILPSLNTNSVFADIFALHGFGGLTLALVVLAGAGVVFGFFSQSVTPLLAVSGVLLYSFMEFWRVYLLTQGIVVFAVLVTVFTWFISGLVTTRSARGFQSRNGARLNSPA